MISLNKYLKEIKRFKVIRILLVIFKVKIRFIKINILCISNNNLNMKNLNNKINSNKKLKEK